MKMKAEIIKGLECCNNNACFDCPYEEIEGGSGCCITLLDDAKRQIIDLSDSLDEKEVILELQKRCLEEERSSGGEYWDNICKLNARQESKGKSKYGVPLEENTTLTRNQRIEHLEEELIDGLKYCEHLKAVNDDGITANDYQRAAMRTAGDDESGYLLNGVMGLCGEAGEVIDLVKKHLHQGHELDRDKVAEELGDVLWYAALISEAVGATLSEVMERNIDKLKQRYPEGFDKARSVNRDKD